jgi:hypothetical protein
MQNYKSMSVLENEKAGKEVKGKKLSG